MQFESGWDGYIEKSHHSHLPREEIFELDLADTGSDSFWHSARKIFGCTRKQFIATANIGDKAAAARGAIYPGGFYFWL